MARIPYTDAQISEPAGLVEEIRQRRGGELLNLDRMLLHAPGYADGWNTFIKRLRESMALPDHLAELCICAVGTLTNAPYEIHHHGPRLLASGGSQAQLDALARPPEQWLSDPAFSDQERALLSLSITMTRDIEVPDEVFEAARTVVPDSRQFVELVGVIAAYNMVSRFLRAFQIEPEN